MTSSPNTINAREIVRQFIRQEVRRSTSVEGHTSATFRFDLEGRHFIVKTALGWGPAKWISKLILQREFVAYRQLSELSGIPRCFGLVDGEFLLLEYIDAIPIRRRVIQDHELYYQRLHALITSVHHRGVTHGDLKSQDNILISGDEQPFLIDFGLGFIYKPGPHPLNHMLHNFVRKVDINSYLKHKYSRRETNIELMEQNMIEPTLFEKVSRWVREIITWMTRGIKNF